MGAGIKISKRAIRRHHYERLKKKRSNYRVWSQNPAKAGFLVTTPTPCSCVMCGNPRRHFGELTIQEIRQKEKEASQCAFCLPLKRRGSTKLSR